MAKGKSKSNTSTKVSLNKKRNLKGIHSKKKNSSLKSSKNYTKKYRGQGR